MNNNENYGDVDCLKSNIENIKNMNGLNGTFCPYKSINLMDYSDEGQVEKRKSYANDIKLLSCDEPDEPENVISNKLPKQESRPDGKQTEDTKPDKASLTNGDIEHEILNGLDLKTNLMLCNSTNIFNEVVEDVVEVAGPTPLDETNKSNSTTEKTNEPFESRPSNTDLPPTSGQNLISTQTSNQMNQTTNQISIPNSVRVDRSSPTPINKDLIDKNLISLATEKLLKNSKLEQIIREQPLMQVEQLGSIVQSKTISELHQNSRELIEQLSEQLDEQIDAQLERHVKHSLSGGKQTDTDKQTDNDKQANVDKQTDANKQTDAEKPNKETNKEKQIELMKEQLIEQLGEPAIGKIADFTTSLITQQGSDLSRLEDSQENRTMSQYHDETRDSQNTTPVDSEFSFKFSNRTLLKDSSADYEEVFDDSYLDDDLNNGDESYLDRLKRLEEEQEHLNSSLIALTSHFAQVQLRLKQIVGASPEHKENLLKELEEFAFRGIPDYRLPELEEFNRGSSLSGDDETNEHNPTCQKSSKLQLQRDKQKELILKLKEQLEDLEQYAYDTGNPNIIPSSMIMERQSVIIEELKGKLPLELDKLEKMSPEELRKQIDKAIRDLVNPVIMKEQLVDQLKTQVSDLERFIEFLQEGKICIKSSKKGGLLFNGNVSQLMAKCECSCTSKHSQECVNTGTGSAKKSDSAANDKQKAKNRTQASSNRNAKAKANRKPDDEMDDNEKAAKMIKRALALLQMFTFLQFGCNTNPVMHKGNKFERNTLKKTNKINHWGDLRAKLELSIEHLIELTKQKHLNDSDYTSECEESILIQTNEKITNTVRKQLCVLLRDLLEHGLNTSLNGCVSSDDRVMHQADYSSFMSWNCFSQKSRLIHLNDRRVTVWDVILKYFYLKKGDQFRQTPARKLSMSFNLDIVGGVPITPKQTLLSCIDEIVDTHTKLKRSADSHFKAFVSRALNERRLVTWLKLIFKCKTIVNRFYEPWSFVNSTAFDEGLKSLDRLTNADLPQLPTDIAIRQLQNINEAF